MPADDPPPVHAAVLGRYAGVVEVLAGMLIADGIDVITTWAANATDGPPPIPTGDVVPVIPVSPGDDTLDRLRRLAYEGHVVGIVWHPDDELGQPPPPVTLVRAGTIYATLSTAVRRAASLTPPVRHPR